MFCAKVYENLRIAKQKAFMFFLLPSPGRQTPHLAAPLPKKSRQRSKLVSENCAY